MKKITGLILIMILVFSLTACDTSDKKESKSGPTTKIYYITEGDKAGIVNSNLASSDEMVKSFDVQGDKDIVLPGEIDSFTLFAIDGGAFNEPNELRSVYIPDSVKIIEPGAFSGCDKGLVIYGSEKSSASEFAEENGFEFEVKTND